MIMLIQPQIINKPLVDILLFDRFSVVSRQENERRITKHSTLLAALREKYVLEKFKFTDCSLLFKMILLIQKYI